MYTIQAEGEKQVCDNMNKICESLMISILMTNHHANQFIFCGLKLQTGIEKYGSMKMHCENYRELASSLKTTISRYGCSKECMSREKMEGLSFSTQLEPHAKISILMSL